MPDYTVYWEDEGVPHGPPCRRRGDPVTDGTLRITDVNGWRVVAPEGPMTAYPTAHGRYRRIDVAGWQGVAWQASQYLPVGEYEFTWIEEDKND